MMVAMSKDSFGAITFEHADKPGVEMIVSGDGDTLAEMVSPGPVFGVNSRLCCLQEHPTREGEGQCMEWKTSRGAKPPSELSSRVALD